MAFGQGLAGLMHMSDAVWARHANPWSVWTRLPILPALALAVWSRAWIGWGCLLPVLALVVWTWANPRAFPPPRSTASWASRAVLGERIWLARAATPIPAHHARAAEILGFAAALGLMPLAFGLWVYDAGYVLCGLAIVLLAKLWFLDRMVWLHADSREPIDNRNGKCLQILR